MFEFLDGNVKFKIYYDLKLSFRVKPLRTPESGLIEPMVVITVHFQKNKSCHSIPPSSEGRRFTPLRKLLDQLFQCRINVS